MNPKQMKDKIYSIVTQSCEIVDLIGEDPDDFCTADGLFHDAMELLQEAYGICKPEFQNKAHEVIESWVGNPARGISSTGTACKIPKELDKELEKIVLEQQKAIDRSHYHDVDYGLTV